MPPRCSTSAVPEVASTSKPSSTSARAGKTRLRLSRLATETKTLPLVGSAPYAPDCALAYAVPKTLSMPMTSPVERISGPSTVSTPRP